MIRKILGLLLLMIGFNTYADDQSEYLYFSIDASIEPDWNIDDVYCDSGMFDILGGASGKVVLKEYDDDRKEDGIDCRMFIGSIVEYAVGFEIQALKEMCKMGEDCKVLLYVKDADPKTLQIEATVMNPSKDNDKPGFINITKIYH